MLDRYRALQLIEKSGRTRKWLADRCGIAVKTLNNGLAGRAEFSRPVIMLLAHSLEVSLEEITCGHEAERIEAAS